MNRAILAAAMLFSLAVAGCTTAQILPPAADVPVAQGVATIDASYNVAAQAYLAALPTLTAAQKAQIKPLLVRAYAAVQAADAAQGLGDATTINQQVALASSLIAQARSLLSARTGP